MKNQTKKLSLVFFLVPFLLTPSASAWIYDFGIDVNDELIFKIDFEDQNSKRTEFARLVITSIEDTGTTGTTIVMDEYESATNGAWPLVPLTTTSLFLVSDIISHLLPNNDNYFLPNGTLPGELISQLKLSLAVMPNVSNIRVVSLNEQQGIRYSYEEINADSSMNVSATFLYNANGIPLIMNTSVSQEQDNIENSYNSTIVLVEINGNPVSIPDVVEDEEETTTTTSTPPPDNTPEDSGIPGYSTNILIICLVFSIIGVGFKKNKKQNYLK